MRTIHNYRNLITPVINRILSRTIKCSKAHNLNASASVEGAIVIPLFIYAVMSIMFIMQVIAVRIHINNAFYVTLRKCAGYVYVYENSGNVPKGMVAETIRRLLIDEIGTDYAADHNIMGGNAGIMFMSSKILNDNSVIDIKLTYSIKNPFDIFGLSTIRVTDRKRINAWLGEDKDNFAGNVSDKEYVYITAGGEVYHTNKECTYLLRYILEADRSCMDVLRNASGAKYYSCEHCGQTKDTTSIYYTLYGTIWLAAMSYADIKRRKINIISIVVMGAGIIMLHLADVIDGSELELHLLIRDYYIPAVIIGAGLYIIARITHITGEADAIVIAYITVLKGMYITIQTVLLSMFLIIIAGGTLIAGGRMKLRTSMPYIPFLLVSLVCCVIGGGTILRTLLQ